MRYYFISLFVWSGVVLATPPACFLSCINEVAKECEKSLVDLTCLCVKQDQVLGCLVDICPYGTFESSRDHYFGTCLEHGRSTNGNYPPGYKPPEILSSALSSFTMSLSTTSKTESTQTSIAESKTSSVGIEYDDCEWEEEETVDENGWVKIIRKPINVPPKYLSSPGRSKRTVIIKHTKPIPELGDTQDPKETNSHAFSHFQRIKKPHTLKTRFP